MNKGTGISFDALFSNASMGIIVTDEQGQIVLANPYLSKQFGYTEAEIVGSSIELLIPSRFHPRHKLHLHNYNEHPQSRPMGVGMELFAVRKNGSEFPIEVSLGNYGNDKGKFIIAFLSDISKRKEAENALIQLNIELESIVEERTLLLTQQVAETEAKDAELNRVNNFLNNIWAIAEAIIFVTDVEGTIKMFNTTAEKHLGYTASEMINLKSPSIFHMLQNVDGIKDETLDCEFDTLCKRADLGLSNECEVIYQRKDGTEFPVSLNLTSMHDANGKVDGYLGIAIDTSVRKKAETDLRLALEKEKELSKLKSAFVSLASHEFRTPLSTILSSTYLISKYTETEDHPKRERHIQRIVSSVNMLTDILNDFLSVGKIEEGKIQVRLTDFNLEGFITETIAELNGILKKGQSIHYEHEGNANVLLDQGLLKHIAINLLSNAIKFSPENAQITVHTKKESENITLFFTDKGMGISTDDQQHLFERFFRGANAAHVQGTGLGLHIVSKYVELMNGTITCSSALNTGTTFKIVFIITPNK